MMRGTIANALTMIACATVCLASSILPHSQRMSPTQNMSTGMMTNAPTLAIFSPVPRIFSIISAETFGFFFIAAAVARVNSASITGCSTPLLSTTSVPTTSVTTSMGTRNPECSRRRNTVDGAYRMSMKSSHQEALGVATASPVRDASSAAGSDMMGWSREGGRAPGCCNAHG